MDIKIKFDCSGVDWQQVASTLKEVGMAHFSPEIHEKAFKASHTTVFIYDGNRLIGFGRAISDGAYQTAIYDCAVWPEYQGKRIGSIIMENILKAVGNCNIILYAAPGKEGFYKKHGFSKMKTGMAKFMNKEFMKIKGFTE